MDLNQQKRQEDFLRNYHDFRRKVKMYILNSKFEENLYELSLNFEIEQIEYEIVLALNLINSLPQPSNESSSSYRRNVQFRFTSNSKLLKHILMMASMQNQCARADIKIKDNQEQIEGLVMLQKQYTGKVPLILQARLQKVDKHAKLSTQDKLRRSFATPCLSMLLELESNGQSATNSKPIKLQLCPTTPTSKPLGSKRLTLDSPNDQYSTDDCTQLAKDEVPRYDGRQNSRNVDIQYNNEMLLTDLSDQGDIFNSSSKVIDPRLLEEIIEASEESNLSGIEESHQIDQEKKIARSRFSQFQNQFLEQQIHLLQAIRPITHEINSLPDPCQLIVLRKLRESFSEMKTAVMYQRSVFVFQEMVVLKVPPNTSKTYQ